MRDYKNNNYYKRKEQYDKNICRCDNDSWCNICFGPSPGQKVDLRNEGLGQGFIISNVSI